jgi:hypothetical protein
LLPTRLRPPAPGRRRSVESLFAPFVVVGTFDDTQNNGKSQWVQNSSDDRRIETSSVW